jgi:hypothetical protein
MPSGRCQMRRTDRSAAKRSRSAALTTTIRSERWPHPRQAIDLSIGYPYAVVNLLNASERYKQGLLAAGKQGGLTERLRTSGHLAGLYLAGGASLTRTHFAISFYDSWQRWSIDDLAVACFPHDQSFSKPCLSG